MRTQTLLLSLALLTATLALLPAADAAQQACLATSKDCGGLVCVSKDSDQDWSSDECVSKRDLDRCQYQSDCCASSSFWCPETD